MTAERVNLGELIWQVRRELEEVKLFDKRHPLRFDVDTVELDVTVEATGTSSGGGSLNLKVIGMGTSLEGSHEVAKGSTATIHLVLKPRDMRSENGKYQVADEDTENITNQDIIK